MLIFLPRRCATKLREQWLECSRWVAGTKSRPMADALKCQGVGKPLPRGACAAMPLRFVSMPARCVKLAEAS